MDQSAMTQARLVRSPQGAQGGSLKLKERSMSVPTRPASQAGNPIKGGGEELRRAAEESSDSFPSSMDSPRLEVGCSLHHNHTHFLSRCFKFMHSCYSLRFIYFLPMFPCRFDLGLQDRPTRARREPACPMITTYCSIRTFSMTMSLRLQRCYCCSCLFFGMFPVCRSRPFLDGLG